MKDPVTGFLYPAEWVEKCSDPALLALVEQGLFILTASGTGIRRGYTTGTTAAAACKAAILSLTTDLSSVTVTIPCGLTVCLPVIAHVGKAECTKYAGDYLTDVTSGLRFVAEATPVPDGINLLTGDGIGRFVRDTPRYPKGTPAISSTPLACILRAVEEALEVTGIPGISVTLTVPEGDRVAKKTLNSRVGVENGISILGNTGLVEPWDDHLTESVMERVAAARNPVLTTGRVGLRYARLLFPEREVILVGGKIDEAIRAARGDVVLCGLPALVLRYINPGVLEGTGYLTVEELAASPDFDHIVPPLLARFKKMYPHVRVVIVNRDGSIIAESP
ncbi:MAG: cobalt-precorrin-5B (C(1))-methyltransferase [Methanoregula sp.]|nr:cobalt-precorrin-5B (C(1))-methyltransferase [Methanoregula sp.]